jgi:pyrroline-5-carboxylate reductase
VAFLGVGNMGEAVLAGFIRAGIIPGNISIYDVGADRLQSVAEMHGVRKATNIPDVIAGAGICVLAVKPKDMQAASIEIAQGLAEAGVNSQRPIIVSVAAGLSTDKLASWFAAGQPIVRVMPNTPAAIGKGVSAISGGASATAGDTDLVAKLFSGCGTVAVVPESQQTAVGALSGSGPAYVFYLIDALAEAGVVNGLPRDLSLELATQTVLGSAALLAETGEHPALARERVTSPGGTTAAALRELDAAAVRAAVINAVAAAVKRTAELS